MSNYKFTEEQLAALNQLSEALQNCRELDIHISGLSDFGVNIFEDAEGNNYVAIS